MGRSIVRGSIDYILTRMLNESGVNGTVYCVRSGRRRDWYCYWTPTGRGDVITTYLGRKANTARLGVVRIIADETERGDAS